MNPAHVIVRRTEITQATLDRFKDRPFAFGSADCVQLAAFHLRAMGHRVLLTKGGRYQTAIGAVRALRRAGHRDLRQALDAMLLEPIAPAAAWTGDIIAMPPEEGAKIEALGIALGNGRVLGWHPDAAGAAVLQPDQYLAAWRVPLVEGA